MNELVKKKFDQVIYDLEFLKDVSDTQLMLEELDAIITVVVPELSVVAELDEPLIELMSLKIVLYDLFGFLYSFDSPRDYIELAIQEIKRVYIL